MKKEIVTKESLFSRIIYFIVSIFLIVSAIFIFKSEVISQTVKLIMGALFIIGAWLGIKITFRKTRTYVLDVIKIKNLKNLGES